MKVPKVPKIIGHYGFYKPNLDLEGETFECDGFLVNNIRMLGTLLFPDILTIIEVTDKKEYIERCMYPYRIGGLLVAGNVSFEKSTSGKYSYARFTITLEQVDSSGDEEVDLNKLVTVLWALTFSLLRHLYILVSGNEKMIHFPDGEIHIARDSIFVAKRLFINFYAQSKVRLPILLSDLRITDRDVDESEKIAFMKSFVS